MTAEKADVHIHRSGRHRFRENQPPCPLKALTGKKNGGVGGKCRVNSYEKGCSASAMRRSVENQHPMKLYPGSRHRFVLFCNVPLTSISGDTGSLYIEVAGDVVNVLLAELYALLAQSFCNFRARVLPFFGSEE